MSKIRDKHAPLKKPTKYELKLKTKPWITTALRKSISIKSKFFKDYIDKKDLTKKSELRSKYKSYRNILFTMMITKKSELHHKYKSYRNILFTLMKKSKQNYFT